jgi:hypothetical protein
MSVNVAKLIDVHRAFRKLIGFPLMSIMRNDVNKHVGAPPVHDRTDYVWRTIRQQRRYVRI